MELGGSFYLYAIAAMGMTFATMSAVIIVLRHASGVPLTSIQSFAVQAFIERGFLVAGFSVLPMLVLLFDAPPAAVWRISSAMLFAFFVPYWLTFPRRRRRSAVNRATVTNKGLWVLDWFFTLWALANAAGFPAAPGPGPYAAAMTFFLAHICFVFMWHLADHLGRAKPTTS